jgi:hypothetical protein
VSAPAAPFKCRCDLRRARAAVVEGQREFWIVAEQPNAQAVPFKCVEMALESGGRELVGRCLLAREAGDRPGNGVDNVVVAEDVRHPHASSIDFKRPELER